MSTNDQIRPFTLAVPPSEQQDLRRRLAAARFPDAETVSDESQGVPLTRLTALVEYWRDHYDWTRLENRVNAHPQFLTEIDGVDIHFLHVRSPHAEAPALVLTHGWPGSFIEFLDVIEPLTDPTKHGGTAEDAFHLVIPSVPGFGFSGHPRESWTAARIAEAWAVLMERLGYDRYYAQGGDIGAAVSSHLGRMKAKGLLGVHTGQPFVLPPPPFEDLSSEEGRMLGQLGQFAEMGTGYVSIQQTRPQTLGYGLADSPVGQAAWIYEKLIAWTDSDGAPEELLGLDAILDNISVYWFANAATSSARFYWDNSHGAVAAIEINVPAGVTIFPGEIYTAPRSWCERYMRELVYWGEVDRGGHFPAFEQPTIFVSEVRKFAAAVRSAS